MLRPTNRRLRGALGALKEWARAVKRDVRALYLCSRDPRVPWYAKAMAACVAAYALSPIDLIPDFIPVLGYLDDVIIVPAGIWLAVRLVPPALFEEHRQAALTLPHWHPLGYLGVAMILGAWCILGGAMICALVVRWTG